MRCEKPNAADMTGDMMQDCLGDCYAVVRACAAAEFVKDDERAGSSFGKDLFGFGKFDEEGGLGSEDIVVSPEARHDAIDGGEAGGAAGDVTAYLRHNDCDTGLCSMLD